MNGPEFPRAGKGLILRGRAKVEAVSETGQFKQCLDSFSIVLLYATIVL